MHLLKILRAGGLLLVIALVFGSCSTPPEPPPQEEAPTTAAQPRIVSPEPAGPQVPDAARGEAVQFQVTNEVYSRTFEEIETFIRQLNGIIQSSDFEGWRGHLSPEYAETVSSAEYLAQQSEQPMLKKNNVHLSSLRDYFDYVVVPSRSGAKLDDIEFIDEDHVKAISIIRDTRGLLYLLIREDGRWKIGIW